MRARRARPGPASLERLLGAPCYHMAEVFAHPDHVPMWHAAARGRMPDWRAADGWTPLCAALGVPVPDEPFPRVNTREDFLAGDRPTGA